MMDVNLAVKKMESFLADNPGRAIANGDGNLSRSELKLLVRRGYLEAAKTREQRWRNGGVTESYVYRRIR